MIMHEVKDGGSITACHVKLSPNLVALDKHLYFKYPKCLRCFPGNTERIRSIDQLNRALSNSLAKVSKVQKWSDFELENRCCKLGIGFQFNCVYPLHAWFFGLFLRFNLSTCAVIPFHFTCVEVNRTVRYHVLASGKGSQVHFWPVSWCPKFKANRTCRSFAVLQPQAKVHQVIATCHTLCESTTKVLQEKALRRKDKGHAFTWHRPLYG